MEEKRRDKRKLVEQSCMIGGAKRESARIRRPARNGKQIQKERKSLWQQRESISVVEEAAERS